MRSRSPWWCRASSIPVVLVIVSLIGCADSNVEECNRVRAIVSIEMKDTKAFGDSLVNGTFSYGKYADDLRRASGGVRAVDAHDPALRKAADSYVDATTKLAAVYDAEAAARDAGTFDKTGDAAMSGIINGKLLDQSRFSIGKACPK